MKKEISGIDRSQIADIFLFGSAVKGKEFPKDVDICIIFRYKIIKEAIKDIEDRIKNLNVHISSLVIDNFFTTPHSLIKTLLVEGVSIITGKSFAENFGFSSRVIYSYSLSNLKPTEKVRFVYLLKGRNREGIVKKMNGEWVTDSCFIMPIQKDSEMITILKKWAIDYKRREILIH